MSLAFLFHYLNKKASDIKLVSLYSTIPSLVLSFIWLLSIPSLSFTLKFVQVLSSSMVLITVRLFRLMLSYFMK